MPIRAVRIRNYTPRDNTVRDNTVGVAVAQGIDASDSTERQIRITKALGGSELVAPWALSTKFRRVPVVRIVALWRAALRNAVGAETRVFRNKNRHITLRLTQRLPDDELELISVLGLEALANERIRRRERHSFRLNPEELETIEPRYELFIRDRRPKPLAKNIEDLGKRSIEVE